MILKYDMTCQLLQSHMFLKGSYLCQQMNSSIGFQCSSGKTIEKCYFLGKIAGIISGSLYYIVQLQSFGSLCMKCCSSTDNQRTMCVHMLCTSGQLYLLVGYFEKDSSSRCLNVAPKGVLKFYITLFHTKQGHLILCYRFAIYNIT